MEVISWNNTEFIQGQIDIKVLSENKSAKEIQIIMAENALMKEHKAEFDITVQVLKGKIEFNIKNEKIILAELDMIALQASVPHSLYALKDSVIRLSLAKQVSIKIPTLNKK